MNENKLAPNLLNKLQQPQAMEADAPPVPVIIKYRQGVMRSQTVMEGVEAKFVYKLTPTVAATMAGGNVFALTDQDARARDGNPAPLDGQRGPRDLLYVVLKFRRGELRGPSWFLGHGDCRRRLAVAHEHQRHRSRIGRLAGHAAG